MTVELGRTWCVRHGYLRFARFLGSSGRAGMLNRDVRAQRHAPPQARLRQSNRAGRRLDSTTKEEGDRASTSEEETD